jgi:branched-chain amino acid transport system permease protein
MRTMTEESNPIKRLYLTILAVIIVGAIIPLFVSPYISAMLMLVFINMVMAESYNIIGGFTGYPTFGHGVNLGIGAYVTALLFRDFGFSPLITFPLAGLIAALFALGVGFPVLRVRGIYFAMITVSLNWVVALIITLTPYTGGPYGIVIPYAFEVETLNRIGYAFYYALCVILIFISYKISRSKLGYGLFAIREDEDACRLLGVTTTKLKLYSYAISSFFAGAAGGLYPFFFGYIDPTVVFAITWSITPIAAAYLGGVGTLFGPVLGSVIITLLAENLRYLFTAYEGLHMLVTYLITLIILLYRREGILGGLRKI